MMSHLVAIAATGTDIVKAFGTWWRVQRASDAVVAKVTHAAQVQAAATKLKGGKLETRAATAADMERGLAEEAELVCCGVIAYAVPIVDEAAAAWTVELEAEAVHLVRAIELLAEDDEARPPLVAELALAADRLNAHRDATLEAERVTMQKHGEFTACSVVPLASQSDATHLWVGSLDVMTRRIIAQRVGTLTFDREAAAARLARFLGA